MGVVTIDSRILLSLTKHKSSCSLMLPLNVVNREDA